MPADFYTCLHDAWELEFSQKATDLSFGEWVSTLASGTKPSFINTDLNYHAIQYAARQYKASCIRCPNCLGRPVECPYCENLRLVSPASAREFIDQNPESKTQIETVLPSKETPKCCPLCTSNDIVHIVEWAARSLEPHDRDNTAVLLEYQCRKCQTAFWV